MQISLACKLSVYNFNFDLRIKQALFEKDLPFFMQKVELIMEISVNEKFLEEKKNQKLEKNQKSDCLSECSPGKESC